MNKRILNRYNFWLFCLLLSLASCSAEQLANDSTTATGQPVEVRLQVRARSGSSVTDNENAINRLRLVVLGSAGSRDAGKLILNKYYATPPASLTEIITSGKRDIYLMANEPLNPDGTEQDSYKNIATVADIRKLSLGYQGAGAATNYIPSEIPMFLEHLDQQIVVNSSNELSGELERMMAKVTLILKVNAAHFIPSDQRVIIDHVTIKNLPTESYLKAKKYQGTLVSSETQTATAVMIDGNNSEYTHTFYVPEYLLTDPNMGASIEIVGHRNGYPTMTSKWSVKLGDAMDDAKRYGDRYDITRNRHYTFTGQVKSYGETEDWEVKVKVLGWGTKELEDNLGRSVSFVGLTDDAGNKIDDGSNLAEEGVKLKVLCSTDAGGWYTVTRNAKGAIIHRSDATALVSSAMDQTVEVPIPNLGNVLYPQTYQVSIYHLTLAPESIGPVKTLSFTQIGGFIPNSELIRWGWMTNLPDHGLQVAKRGNQVLPSGVAEEEDAAHMWIQSAPFPFPSTGTKMELGAGVSNSTKLDDSFTAAKYCREMGEGWFLPSKAELHVMYSYSSNFSSSYSFGTVDDNTYYWSSSQVGDTNLIYAFGWLKGNSSNRDYGNFSRIRCVRRI